MRHQLIFFLHITGQKYEPEPYVPPVTDPSPVPPPSPTKSKKGEKAVDKKSEKGSATPDIQVQLNVSFLTLLHCSEFNRIE